MAKCPNCKKTMSWQEGLLDGGDAKGRYYCSPCRIYGPPEEARAIKKGRRLAQDKFKQDESYCMDPEITRLPCMVQIGILREWQK